MANALEWVLKLRDQMSGPAKKMQDSLRGLSGGLSGLAASASDVQSGFQTLAANPIFGAVIDAYKLAGRALVAGAQMAIEAASFKEDTIAAFSSLVGGQQAAVELFDKADELAGRLGLADEQVVGQLRKLMTSGFSSDTALGVVQAAADLAAARGSEAADAFSSLIATMEAKGKFDSRSMLQFAKLGIRAEDVYDSLAKKLKKTRAEVEALVKAGQIDASTGIEAVLDTVQGKFGGAGAKAADTFSKLLFRVKDAIGDLFQDVDLGPLKDVLRNVLAVFNGPAGEELKAAVTDLFSTIFDVMTRAFQGPEGQARIAQMFRNLASTLQFVADVIARHGPQIIDTMGKIFDLFNKKSDGSSGWGAAMDILRAIVDFAADLMQGDVVGTIDTIIALFNRLFGMDVPSFSDLLSKMWDGLPDFGGDAMGIGQQIINGLVSGILGGASAVVSSIVSVATAAIRAAESALQIRSPSRVFEGLGSLTAQGFAAGVENDNAAPSAMTAMVAPPPASVAARSGAARGAASGGSQRGGGTVTIHINGGDLDKVRRVVAETLEDAGLAVA